MKVILVDCTLNPEKKISEIASICYGTKPNPNMMQFLIDNHHTSVLEHCVLTFKIENISRTCSHQIVRHRTGISFTQESQRYTVNENVIIPESMKYLNEVQNYIDEGKKLFETLINIKEIKKEDARFILPQGSETNMYITMNFRALLHFYSERACEHAQWEISEVAEQMKELIKDISPTLYKNMIPRCNIYKSIKCKNKNCKYYK